MNPLHRIFVYGTLKRGGINHHFLRRARHVVATHTLLRFTMVSCGPFPAIVADGRREVYGEVYEVDQATLRELDKLEDVPNLYERVPITLADGSAAEAWVMRPEDAADFPVIPSGRWMTAEERARGGTADPNDMRCPDPADPTTRQG